eukprot:gnl/TRDRNA2_/TRDRNA2_39051_c0_seq1.p1 gnl/TRDRNA2_/TRDRNA2_39051_c0~~gnl/TRDRNA2_/TRDRNA2_39051_c0_seq1.p1  ORF type:complete len:361 (-),score=62.11 gnl/TRDRNA2_/TRDRNA2_39051_c0_seq1:74-1156(-)
MRRAGAAAARNLATGHNQKAKAKGGGPLEVVSPEELKKIEEQKAFQRVGYLQHAADRVLDKRRKAKQAANAAYIKRNASVILRRMARGSWEDWGKRRRAYGDDDGDRTGAGSVISATASESFDRSSGRSTTTEDPVVSFVPPEDHVELPEHDPVIAFEDGDRNIDGKQDHDRDAGTGQAPVELRPPKAAKRSTMGFAAGIISRVAPARLRVSGGVVREEKPQQRKKSRLSSFLSRASGRSSLAPATDSRHEPEAPNSTRCTRQSEQEEQQLPVASRSSRLSSFFGRGSRSRKSVATAAEPAGAEDQLREAAYVVQGHEVDAAAAVFFVPDLARRVTTFEAPEQPIRPVAKPKPKNEVSMI